MQEQAGHGVNTSLATSAVALSVSPMAEQITTPPTTQKNPPQGAPAPATSAATPEQKLQKAYADIRSTSERLSKIEVPMDTEPAFAFRP
jgi:hypothetical protein